MQLWGVLFKPKGLQVFPPTLNELDMEAGANPCGLLSSLYIPDLVWYLVLKEQSSLSFMVFWLEL